MSEIYRVLVTCDLGAEALALFHRQPGFEVQVRNIKDAAVLAETVAGFHALVVRSNVKVTAEVLEAGTELQVVGRAGIGVDNIDVEAATRCGIAVVNTPGGNVVTTGEHAVALLLSLARKIPQASASMKENRWEKKRFMGRELRGKTLGIIGVGRVGSIVADRALGLKMRVIGCDPFLSADQASQLGIERVELDRLLREADFITAHTPLTSETRGLLGKSVLQQVKPGVLIVNCSRGAVVDQDALLEAIEDGRVAGAALDVFEVEPPQPHPLFLRDEVILTPHLGASTVEAQASVAIEVAENIISYLTQGVAPNTLNVPSVPEETLKRLGPYLELSEHLGLLLGQLVSGPVESAQILVQGQAAAEGTDLVTASFLKGLLSPMLSGRVNTVNAPAVARQRGIQVLSSTTAEIRDFAGLVSARVTGPWGSYEVDGTLFGRREPRLVRFNAYRLDALPRGTLILIDNDDVPGVIGDIGTCLGGYQVNIAGMYNGRDAVGGKAICLVNVDQPATDETLQALRALPHIRTVRQIFL